MRGVDRSPKAVAKLVGENAVGSAALAEMVGKLTKPRAVWMMVPAASVDETIAELSSALYERFSSRGEADFADKALSAMRYEFGGHLEKPASGVA